MPIIRNSRGTQIGQNIPGVVPGVNVPTAGAPTQQSLQQILQNIPAAAAPTIAATGQPGNLADLVAQRVAEGNQFQQQQGTQSSDFASQGQTTQQQASQNAGQVDSTSSQASNIAQTGQETQNLNENLTQTGSQNEQTTQGQTGTVTSGVNDTLGLSGLVSSDVANAGVNEAARSNFLTDLVNNGSGSTGTNIEAAINASLSGPGNIGIGNEAKGRIAGSAAANVARNETAQQLQAAQQLSGPTASSSVISSGTPLLDQTQDTTSQIIGNTLQTTQQDQNRGVQSENTTANNQVGNTVNQSQQNTIQNSLANLVNSAVESGTSSGNFNQNAAGVVPEGGGGGGTVICTALNDLGLITDSELFEEEEYIQRNWDKWGQVVVGYRRWATPVAKWLKKHPFVAFMVRPLVRSAMQVTQDRGNFISTILAMPIIEFSRFLGREQSIEGEVA